MSEVNNKEASVNEILDNAINPAVTIKPAPLTGRFGRKVKRNQTVHLLGRCPNCGQFDIKFYKDYRINSKTSAHNVWICPKCKKMFERKELDYVKYR